MYEAYFDLKRRPFPNTPNPADYFPGGGHEEAFKLLTGFLADTLGDYRVAFLILAMVTGVGELFFALAKKPAIAVQRAVEIA